MDFRILGSTEVLDGARRVAVPTGRGRSLLALLVLHAGEAVAADRIIDALWGEDPPPTASTVLQGLVSRLRRALEPGRAKGGRSELLETVGGGYRLAIDPQSVDANRFKQMVDQARGAPTEARSAILACALGLWRGPALADFAYEPFAQRAIAALEELRVQAIEDRVEADLAIRRGGDLVAELEEVIAVNPFRERLHGFLMLALYRAGRQAAALEAYRRARSLLGEELGLEPGPALRQLEAAIYRQDPTLELQPRAPTGHGRDAEPSSWLPRERRTVTVVAVDLAPAADAETDPEALGRLGSRAARVAADVLARHGARVERLLGDTMMALFGFPLAREDDALRAVRAALEMRSAVYGLDDDPSCLLRAGIETGEIVVAGPAAALRDALSGPVLAAAGRLLQAASEGDVVLGAAASRVLRGTVIVKPVDRPAMDATQPVAWRVLEVVAGAPAVPRALWAPLVGRQNELTRLRSAFRRAIRSGAVVRMNVLGEAGIGKSRLARELAASIETDANVITLRCPAEGEGAFLPLRQAVVEAAGLGGWRVLHDRLAADGDGGLPLGEIAEAIGLRIEPDSVAVLSAAMRRLLEMLASERPLLVVFDDLHWADPAFLDLIDHLQREAAGRILLLCLARPDLVESRPELELQDTLQLGPLSSGDLESLVAERTRSIPEAALRQIVDVSRGNPLFAEQLLAALDDDTVGAVPVSLRGLLTNRLDRLGPAERDVLRCASVVGIDIERDAVCALLPDAASRFVERHLDALERKRMIERAGPTKFRFCHSLVRHAAYQSMTREDRARLHERLAEWLEHDLSDRPDQVIRYHLDQAEKQRLAAGAADEMRPVGPH